MGNELKGLTLKKVNNMWEGEKYRAVVRFVKGTLMAFIAAILIPVASGASWEHVYATWPQAFAMALLTGLGLGGEKLVRAVKSGK